MHIFDKKHIMRKLLAAISKFFLVSLFGIPQACFDDGTYVCEYGCPTVRYQLNGKVMDEDSNPVPGIKVSLEHPDNPYETDTTSVSGKFVLDELLGGFSLEKVRVYFTDVDGPDNGGEFAADSLDLEVYRIEEGDGNWYNGAFKSDDVEIRLKKK